MIMCVALQVLDLLTVKGKGKGAGCFGTVLLSLMSLGMLLLAREPHNIPSSTSSPRQSWNQRHGTMDRKWYRTAPCSASNYAQRKLLSPYSAEFLSVTMSGPPPVRHLLETADTSLLNAQLCRRRKCMHTDNTNNEMVRQQCEVSEVLEKAC